MPVKAIALAVIWFLAPFLIPARVDEGDLRALLLKNDTVSIEKRLDDLQSRFERGNLTEFQLKAAYGPLTHYDEVVATNLAAWVEAAPGSYVAHLAYGTYLSSVGSAWRGGDYLSKIPKKNLETAVEYWSKAKEELDTSLPLSSRPYLSFYRLMYLAIYAGAPDAARSYLLSANRTLPSNALARDGYVESLLPKWGGSYDAVEAFIAESSSEGVPLPILSQMEAIEEDDIGRSFEDAGDHATALGHFHRALDLAKDAGDDFSYGFLMSSRYHTGLPTRCNC